METTAPIKKILVVALDNIGDAVMATAMLRPLKERYPEATVGFWTKKYAADLFLDQSLLDILHASDPFWDTSPGHGKGPWAEFKKVFWHVRATGYDLVFILNTEWRRSLACWLAKIPHRVGYNRRQSRFFLNFPVDGPAPGGHNLDDNKGL